MSAQRTNKLLLVYPLSASKATGLIERAATIARRKGLEVIVYTPALSTAPPHSDVGANPVPAAISEGIDLSLRHANEAVRELRARDLTARACVDNQQSVIRGALEQVDREPPLMMMFDGADYAEFADPGLTDGGMLERCPVPIWIVNTDKSDGTVLGALELDAGDEGISALDERIASEARQTSKALGTTSHFVHTLTIQSEVPRFIESALPGQAIDHVQQEREDEHVARAHALAERHGIAPENVHIERGELTKTVVDTAQAIDASVVVIGASPRNTLTRLLFDSTPQRLLERLGADVLIVNRSTV